MYDCKFTLKIVDAVYGILVNYVKSCFLSFSVFDLIVGVVGLITDDSCTYT